MTPAELAEANVDMVVRMAKTHCARNGGELDEAIGDGMVGLMHAAHRFEASRGPVFAKFASSAVWGEMIEGHRRRAGLRRVVPTPRAEPLSSDDYELLPSPSAEDQAMDRFALAALLERIADLPDNLRCVVGTVVAGGRFKPLAEAEGVSENAISQRLIVARRKLDAA